MTRRFPRSVYETGSEPDPRFSMANERTFLAWIRTSLGLMAGGVALESFVTTLPGVLVRVAAVLLVLAGIACAGWGWLRWAAYERALREKAPLPGFVGGLLLGLVVVAAGATAIVALALA